MWAQVMTDSPTPCSHHLGWFTEGEPVVVQPEDPGWSMFSASRKEAFRSDKVAYQSTLRGSSLKDCDAHVGPDLILSLCEVEESFFLNPR